MIGIGIKNKGVMHMTVVSQPIRVYVSSGGWLT
jgi:hypothetical protein